VSFFSLYSYPGIRNCQLVIPHVLGAEVVVTLDDDETVVPDYLTAALREGWPATSPLPASGLI